VKHRSLEAGLCCSLFLTDRVSTTVCRSMFTDTLTINMKWKLQCRPKWSGNYNGVSKK